MSDIGNISLDAHQDETRNATLTRREFMAILGGAGASVALSGLGQAAEVPAPGRRPNVVLILTDDQGYGDLGCHGNDKIRTPNLDQFAKESVQFNWFFVSPVCTPTRASLMTGRYNYRTCAIDTYLGRAMMHPDEATIAEMLGPAGYRTGIFGKWHLGDNYPMRCMDKGSQESLVHKGGGIAQPSDPPGNTYFNPILQHSGRPGKHKGYCTDIFTDAAMQFIEQNREQPFFTYLATNAPHDPLQIEERYVEPYRKMGLDETTARIYGMVENIDGNVGRLLERLQELELERNTIVIFMTDNGPQQARYNAGMRGRKGSVYDGGIRVPCFVRWPAGLQGGRKVEQMAAHIDLAPTLLDACGVAKPATVKFDGVSLMPLLRGEKVEWPDRTLYFQWHRGDVPELYRACAARTQTQKLVNGTELYDMVADPGEQQDIAGQHPDVVARMRKGYEEWFRDVSATRGYDPPRIFLGLRFENPVVLTRQDWRGAQGWGDTDLGHWEVDVKRAGEYAITLLFPAARAQTQLHFKLGGTELAQHPRNGASAFTFQPVRLEAGAGRLEAWTEVEGKRQGVSYVEVRPLAAGAPRPEFAPVADDPALPRVLLIGDSISVGYTLPVRELLKRKANVHRIPENGGPTIVGLEQLSWWLGNGKWDVIHFNWGLHDLKMDEKGVYQVPIEQYEQNLRELVARLKATGARLIWASTTPVPDAKVNPPRKSGDVVAYNAVAERITDENAVAVDDLYAVALPKLGQIQLPANVHFTAQGYQVLAEAVAGAIQAELGKTKRG